MDRREFLGIMSSAGLASTAGCINRFVGQSAGQRIIKDIQADPQPPESEIFHSVRIKNEQSSENGPAQIAVTISNNGESQRRIRGPSNNTFSSQRSEDDEVVIVRPEFWTDDMVKSNRCWELKNETVVTTPSAQMLLAQDETIEETYDILSSAQSNTCIEPGEYRFVTEFEILVGTRRNSRLQAVYPWGFNIVIDTI